MIHFFSISFKKLILLDPLALLQLNNYVIIIISLCPLQANTLNLFTALIPFSTAVFLTKSTKLKVFSGVSLEKNLLNPELFITDEMGLGKTIIVIMTCLINIKKSTLFVLPSSLLLQVETTNQKFTGHDALVYHGYSKKKISKLDLLSNPIVLTTYHSIAISKNTISLPFFTILLGTELFMMKPTI